VFRQKVVRVNDGCFGPFRAAHQAVMFDEENRTLRRCLMAEFDLALTMSARRALRVLVNPGIRDLPVAHSAQNQHLETAPESAEGSHEEEGRGVSEGCLSESPEAAHEQDE
jgi:hypothetical protein